MWGLLGGKHGTVAPDEKIHDITATVSLAGLAWLLGFELLEFPAPFTKKTESLELL